MGHKKRKNRKKNKKKNNKKKKNVTNNDHKKSISLNDIFILDEIFIENSKQIINMEIEEIIDEVNIDYIKNKILFNISSMPEENNSDKEIVNKDVYKEISEELEKYKKNNLNLNKCYLDIPLNDWGKWIYV